MVNGTRTAAQNRNHHNRRAEILAGRLSGKGSFV